jgi:hypothetical protein
VVVPETAYRSPSETSDGAAEVLVDDDDEYEPPGEQRHREECGQFYRAGERERPEHGESDPDGVYSEVSNETGDSD